MYPCKLEDGGISFHCAEQLYQYKKLIAHQDLEGANEILKTKDGFEAKIHAAYLKRFSQNWYGVRKQIMREVLEKKYSSCTKSRNTLAETRFSVLIGSTSNRYWGMGMDKNLCTPNLKPDDIPGENHLGKLLMELREKKTTTNGPSKFLFR